MQEARHVIAGAAIYVGAAILISLPSFFLAFGLQALGGVLGWWHGDPNSNDGEESWATTIGAIGTVAVLVAAGIGYRAVARRHQVSALPGIAIGTAAVLIGYAALYLWAFTA